MPERPPQKIDLSNLPTIEFVAKHYMKPHADRWAGRLVEAKLPENDKAQWRIVLPVAVCMELDRWRSDVDHAVPCLLIDQRQGYPCEIMAICYTRGKAFGAVILQHKREFAEVFGG